MTTPVSINSSVHRSLPSIPNPDSCSRRSSNASENHYVEIGDFVPQEINQAHSTSKSTNISFDNAKINNISEVPETCSYIFDQSDYPYYHTSMLEKVVHALSAAMPIAITAGSIFGGIIAGTIEAATAEDSDHLISNAFSKMLDGVVFGTLAGCTVTVLPFAAVVIGHHIRLATSAQYAERFRGAGPSNTVYTKFLQVKPAAEQSETVVMSELLADEEENIEFDVSQQKADTPTSPDASTAPSTSTAPQVRSTLNFSSQREEDASSEASPLYASIQKKEISKDKVFPASPY